VCGQCGGRGRSGPGRTRCLRCGGPGRLTKEALVLANMCSKMLEDLTNARNS
jgi:DnaJ-class molecular chaperone